MMPPEYSFVLPTYRRPDVLALCLRSIADLDYPLEQIEVRILDNAGPDNTAAVAAEFAGRFPLTYTVNERNLGPGGSINRGLHGSRGQKIVILNDDVILPRSFLQDCDASLSADPRIGCLGFRAIENGYYHAGQGIGHIAESGEVIGNFDEDCGRPIEVEHIYGFCYLVTRAALQRGGWTDATLLTKPYANGNRIETDHCLSIKRAGFKVVYDPAIAVRHLAKPRADMSEVSMRWRLNHLRNTLYLFLKHSGLTGKKCLALRFALLNDLGILSTLRRPSRANLLYFLTGLRARVSAFAHYALYLTGF